MGLFVLRMILVSCHSYSGYCYHLGHTTGVTVPITMAVSVFVLLAGMFCYHSVVTVVHIIMVLRKNLAPEI